MLGPYGSKVCERERGQGTVVVSTRSSVELSSSTAELLSPPPPLPMQIPVWFLFLACPFFLPHAIASLASARCYHLGSTTEVSRKYRFSNASDVPTIFFSSTTVNTSRFPFFRFFFVGGVTCGGRDGDTADCFSNRFWRSSFLAALLNDTLLLPPPVLRPDTSKPEMRVNKASSSSSPELLL